jgi:hypothetical protein
MPTQADLLRTLKRTTDPALRRDCALDLLAATRSREHIDQALQALSAEDVRALLDANHRPLLREKAWFYFENEDRDRGGLIREQITRLLTHIGHREDSDLYLRGAFTYHRQPAIDSAQNLRAAALFGLAAVDPDLAVVHAVRLLGEPDTSQLSGEPSLTALGVLAHQGHSVPIYQFVLLAGERFIDGAQAEVVGKALELLISDLPSSALDPLIESYIARDNPVIGSSIINAVVESRREGLYSQIEDYVCSTRHAEVRYFGAIMLAAARDEVLTDMLLRLARTAAPTQQKDYVEALELLPPGEERDDVLARVKSGERKKRN